MAFILTSRADKSVHSLALQYAVIIAGVGCWLVAAFGTASTLFAPHGALPFNNEDMTGADLSLFVIPATVLMVGAFPVHLPLRARATGLDRATNTVSLADLMVLVTACCVGAAPAIMVAGVDGFVASWRARREFFTSLAALASLSLAAAAASMFVGHGPLATRVLDGTHAGAPAPAVLLLNVLAALAFFAVNTTTAALPFSPGLRRLFRKLYEAEFNWAAALYACLGLVAGAMHLLIGYHLILALAFAAPFVYAFHRAFEQVRVERELTRAALRESHEQIIQALAVAVDAKDEVTHDHVLRVEIYATALGRMLGCTEAEIEALRAGSLLHDIGKVAIPDHILNKPGKLTAEEFAVMKNHTLIGHTILDCIAFTCPVAPVVRHHHEHWDGTGYPDGLKGEEIPLAARILSVVDCFDALREDRPYRRALTREEAVEALRRSAGTTYDPRIVEVFIKHLSALETEIERHKDLESAGLVRYTNSSSRAASERLASYLAEPGSPMALATPAAGLALVAETGPEDTHSAVLFLSSFEQGLARAGTLTGQLDLLTTSIGRFTECRLCAAILPSQPPGAFRHCNDTDYYVAGAVSALPETAAGLLNKTFSLTTEGVVAWTIRTGKPITGTDPSLEPLMKELGAAESNDCADFEAGSLLYAFPITSPGDGVLGAVLIVVGPDQQQEFVNGERIAVVGQMLSLWGAHYLNDVRSSAA